ncbi:MAG: hypothetical protein HYY24_09000 [Verrucomicrobia bacterium]|nr:hypothetical protein [Verrucomicrobiota bacterium]
MLDVSIAHDLRALSLGKPTRVTGAFTLGGGEAKAELDALIRQPLAAQEKSWSAAVLHG